MRQIKSQLYTKGIKTVAMDEEQERLERLEQENITYFLEKYGYNKDLDYQHKRKIISRLLGRGFSYTAIQKSIGKIDESFEI